MLTLDDIKYVGFRKSGLGGYKTEDVDLFIDDVQESFNKLLEEKEKLNNKIESLNKDIQKYRDEEESIRKALLSAQKLADSSIKEAKNKAEFIISDAKVKAERIIFDAQNKSNLAEKQFDVLKKNISDFRQEIIEKYKKHLKLIDSLPTVEYIEHQSENYKTDEYSGVKLLDTNEISVDDLHSKEQYNLDKSNNDEDESKIKKLKFGENYSLDEDNDESPIGIFD